MEGEENGLTSVNHGNADSGKLPWDDGGGESVELQGRAREGTS